MRELGLTTKAAAVALCALVACKAAPEPSPAEPSAPSTVANAGAAPATAPQEPLAPPATAASNDAPQTAGPRIYGEKTKSVSAKLGEHFSIALESNVTLPFKWRLEPPDAAVVTLVEEEKHRDTPPPGCGDCVGYGGTKVFVFEAKAKGTASLHFALKPLTDPAGKSQKEVTVAVSVTE
jgi:predicted secreted protein